MYKIVKREQYSDTTFLWEVEAPDVASSAQAGHFIMLRLREGGERIPLTVADFDRERGTITLVVQAVGKTTLAMLRDYKAGDEFLDFAGPLGLPSVVENHGHVVLVGGGLGVAPIFPQLRAFKEAGNKTTAIIGFRTKDLVFWEEKFRPWCDELIVCTDDGSYGKAGFVTGALEQILEKGGVDEVVAVGPLPMMKACSETSRPFGVSTVVSLNAIMVDGTGMCGSCRVTIDGTVQFACVDGPEFDAHKVDFGELMLRQKRFRQFETTAEDGYEHVCNMQKILFEQEKRNYKKIKDLAPTQTPMPERPAAERATNFKEVNLGFGIAEAMAEAERCIQCRKPTCISGCPVSIDIPRFIRHLMIHDFDGALEVIQESSAFPSICGRVCPQEIQCESQCVIGRKVESVAIGRLERFVGDHATLPDPVAKIDPSKGKVAVVGSGPAGLACAADLAKAGVAVTIYEALHVVGGVLAYGIPSFRLPRETINREVERLEKMGVKIETNKVIGKTFSLEQLLGERGFSAVFVAVGAGYPMFLNIPGEFAGGVFSANEFLTRVNLMGGDRFPYKDTPVNLGDRVVVLGAGNTAMDCLRVSKRLGSSHVHCVYRRSQEQAPARIEELRHAKEEGIEFHWLRSPVEIVTTDAGDVKAIKCQAMKLGEADDSGRRRPVAIEGEFHIIECDTVIYALGTRANPIISKATPDLETHRGGYITADQKTQACNMEGVFAGGDIVSGGATVILAMGAGRRAANGILAYMEQGVWPPVVESEQPAPKKKPRRVKAPPSASAPAADTCLKCHRPIEEGEEYVCCANAPLSWKCTACHKVSEGFAFPYGLCPHCGGTLAMAHEVNTDSAEAQEAIRRAFAIELGGQAFYRRGAQEIEDPRVRELFGRLAAMEVGHMSTLTRRYHAAPPEAGADGPSMAQVAVYADAALPAGNGAELLKLAVHLEMKARDFFTEQVELLEEGTPAWELYQELAAEEQEHVDLLETELQRYLTDKPGLL